MIGGKQFKECQTPYAVFTYFIKLNHAFIDDNDLISQHCCGLNTNYFSLRSDVNMIDSVKEYLIPKTFSVLAYVSSIIHLLCGLAFMGIVIALKEGEAAKFTCNVAADSTAAYKTQVDKTCYSRYQQKFNSQLPFYAFTILSLWFPIVVAVIYSLAVRRRVQEIEATNQEQNRGTLYVFYSYLCHLIIRFLSGILSTILQYAMLFSNGFDSVFNCNLPPLNEFTSRTATSGSASQLNGTSVACVSASASEKQLWSVLVSVFNTGFALIILLEIIRVCRRFPKYICTDGWSSDTEFIMTYLLRIKKETSARDDLEFTNFLECVDFYKGQILQESRTTDVIYGPKTGLDDLYINLLIHTERAPHRFPEAMHERHEIFNVYMDVPSYSVCLKDIKDLFYPEKDTNDKFPRKILAVGRPGIGKTVLTEKIMHDWANQTDEYYRGKIAFYFKFRWFNIKELNAITLKTFLRYGTELSDEKYEEIYEDILKHPEKAILIFDGLDEFNGSADCLDNLPPPSDPNVCMSGISLFMKLISGRLLPGSTVLVTSRPTANELYCRFTFDRTVEVLGFTSDRIEEYVTKFVRIMVKLN